MQRISIQNYSSAAVQPRQLGLYTAVRTVSPKRRLTRPLNGWKPDSRILLQTRAVVNPLCLVDNCFARGGGM